MLLGSTYHDARPGFDAGLARDLGLRGASCLDLYQQNIILKLLFSRPGLCYPPCH